MLDLTNTRHKIIDAALTLAASEGWRDLSLYQISVQAGVPLGMFRKEFSSKTEILASFGRAVDDAVLAQMTPAAAGTVARDRLFDVLMTRFEIMSQYKAGLKRIRNDLRFQPGQSVAQLCSASRSLYWMMVAAGIDAEGSHGALRLPGLIAVYARVFNIWLDDDDPGLARTMAALDKRLRRGERIVKCADDLGNSVRRLCSRLCSLTDRSKRCGTPPPEPAPQPAPPADSGNGYGPGPATEPAPAT